MTALAEKLVDLVAVATKTNGRKVKCILTDHEIGWIRCYYSGHILRNQDA
jgi:hypothetical protein